jgi:putative addiction module killer protein
VEAKPQKVVHHLNSSGDTFGDWMENKITDAKVFAKINIRLKRVAQGNFGDHGPVGEGVLELREHDGAAHRVYYGRESDTVILLTGGTKRTQAADIDRAKRLWKEYSDG